MKEYAEQKQLEVQERMVQHYRMIGKEREIFDRIMAEDGERLKRKYIAAGRLILVSASTVSGRMFLTLVLLGG